MAHPSDPIELRPGVSIRYITPHGGNNIYCPKVPMWRVTKKINPETGELEFPYFAVYDCPVAKNINGGRGIAHYALKGFKLFGRTVINGRAYNGREPDTARDLLDFDNHKQYAGKSWLEVNMMYRDWIVEYRGRADTKTQASITLAEHIKTLVDRVSTGDTETKAVIKLLTEDLELRREELERNKEDGKEEAETTKNQSGGSSGSKHNSDASKAGQSKGQSGASR